MGQRKRQLKQWSGGMRGMLGKGLIASIVLVICIFSLCSSRITIRSTTRTEINLEELWQTAPSKGWRPSSAPRSDWPPPPKETNGYLHVRCNGGLNQQRSAICNAVLAARIMNATLVLPDLGANSFWHDDSIVKRLESANTIHLVFIGMLHLLNAGMYKERNYAPFPATIISIMDASADKRNLPALQI